MADKISPDSQVYFAPIPMRSIGPIKFLDSSEQTSFETIVPMATFESPLWYSCKRGARACNLCGGIDTVIFSDCMTRSILVELTDISKIPILESSIIASFQKIQEIVSNTGRFVKLEDINFRFIGRLAYIRLSMTVGDASGHNMTTKAAEQVLNWILNSFDYTKYVSISGNYCTDKKASAVNGILGRGKGVIAEARLSNEICNQVLKSSPSKIAEINLKKNLLGGIASASVLSANAHYANMLLAVYLATGQDAANIVEGSQGVTNASVDACSGDLIFSVTLPNIIVGVVGNGKGLSYVENNLKLMGCFYEKDDEYGLKSRRLARIIAGVVLCGELSLLAAQTNLGELVNSHMKIERGHNFCDE